MNDVIEDDNGSVGATVARLAKEHEVVYVETDLDAFATIATELAGDGTVKFDETERLILALGRAGVIGRAEAVSMFVAHGREKKLAAAITAYDAEEASLGQAARAAGLSVEEFMRELGKQGIACIRYDAADLAGEIGERDSAGAAP